MFRKTITIIYLTVFIQSYGIPQSFNIEWQGCFGGSDTEYPYDIIQVEDGYLVAGGTKSINGDISFNHGATDSWLFKIDYQGALIWEKTYGGNYGDGTMRIFPTNDNCYYLLGSSYSSDGDITYDPYPESTDYWILKVDSVGNILWDKILGGNTLDQLWTGVSTTDGGVVALGWTGSDDGDISIAYGGYDMWMVKLNSDGEIEWDFSIGTDNLDFGQAIIQTEDGGYLVGGYSYIGGGGNLSCIPHSWKTEAILVKLDADLNIEWQQCYGGSEHDAISTVIELEDGYAFIGQGNSDDGDLTGSEWHGEGDIWVVKVDLFGNILWQKCLGGSFSEFARNIFQTIENGFIIAGNTKSIDGDVTGNHTISEHEHDIWIVKLNSEGELLWEQCFGGIWDEQVNFGFLKKGDNNFVIAGQTDYGPSFDVGCLPHGGEYDKDFWVFEIKDTTTNTINYFENNNGIRVYPNPAKEYVIFELKTPPVPSEHPPGGGNAPPLIPPEVGNSGPAIQILDVYGRSVLRKQVVEEKTVIDLRGIGSGVYFYRLEMDGNLYSGKFVIGK